MVSATEGPSSPQRDTFFREAFSVLDSVTPRVLPYVLACGFFSIAVVVVAWWLRIQYDVHLGLEVGFHEIGGVVLTIAIILRTNAGYDRWWEARKLWGGIVNQCRNLVISCMAYGPVDKAWRESIVRWTSLFPQAAKASLEGTLLPPSLLSDIGLPTSISTPPHLPSFVALKLGELLRQASEMGLPPLAFAQIDRERAALIDHIGGCERILKTPLPQVYSIKIRRVLALFLMTLPFALLEKVGNDWLIPFICLLIAYPLLSLDQIGHELQNPFSTTNLSHLPLETITSTIERNLHFVLEAAPAQTHPLAPATQIEKN